MLGKHCSLDDISLVMFSRYRRNIKSCSCICLTSHCIRRSGFGLILTLATSPKSSGFGVGRIYRGLCVRGVIIGARSSTSMGPCFGPIRLS